MNNVFQNRREDVSQHSAPRSVCAILSLHLDAFQGCFHLVIKRPHLQTAMIDWFHM